MGLNEYENSARIAELQDIAALDRLAARGPAPSVLTAGRPASAARRGTAACAGCSTSPTEPRGDGPGTEGPRSLRSVRRADRGEPAILLGRGGPRG